MTTYIGLLRGINVGKAKRIPMESLRNLLSNLGYTGVVTLLNSGNAVFQAENKVPDNIASEISTAISRQFQMEVPVIIKSKETLDAIVHENNLANNAPDHSRLLVAFVQDSRDLTELEKIIPLLANAEVFEISHQAAYLHCVSGILNSKAANALLGKHGKAATTRNWATVLKLHALTSKNSE